MGFVTWIKTNADILGILVAIAIVVIPAAWTFLRYLRLKNRELHFERFRIYHQIIRDLVQPDSSGESMYLDRQIAIVFELRNFPEYYGLTYRMLQGLKKQWGLGSPKRQRLIGEIDLTLKYIRKKLGKTQQREAQAEAKERETS